MVSKSKTFKKLKPWLTGNPIDFNMSEFKLVMVLFKCGLRDAMAQIPKSGRMQIKFIFKRSK